MSNIARISNAAYTSAAGVRASHVPGEEPAQQPEPGPPAPASRWVGGIAAGGGFLGTVATFSAFTNGPDLRSARNYQALVQEEVDLINSMRARPPLSQAANAQNAVDIVKREIVTPGAVVAAGVEGVRHEHDMIVGATAKGIAGGSAFTSAAEAHAALVHSGGEGVVLKTGDWHVPVFASPMRWPDGNYGSAQPVAIAREAVSGYSLQKDLPVGTMPQLQELGDDALAKAPQRLKDAAADIAQYTLNRNRTLMIAAIPAAITAAGIGAFALSFGND